MLLMLWGLSGCGSSAPAAPLNPNDNMTFWKSANEAQKQATAQKIVELLVANGTINIDTDRGTLSQEMATALDEATNANTKAYVSPGQSMLYSAAEIAYLKKWHQ